MPADLESPVSSDIRKFYADLVTAGGGIENLHLRSAFEAIPRERFLGPGPWQVVVDGGYIETPSANPTLVYQDIVVAISSTKNLNNGLPSLHARCLKAAAPRPGERILHIGAGTGYYTAILAELVGAGGRVEAIEIDGKLAQAAARNLRERHNVSVRNRSGIERPLPCSDIIYVNAGATEPLRVWLESLNPKGRLIFPLTPGWGRGGMLRVTRAKNGFEANIICEAYFTPCVGAQNEAGVAKLKEAFDQGGSNEIRRLHCDHRVPDDTCWVKGENWWLSKA